MRALAPMSLLAQVAKRSIRRWISEAADIRLGGTSGGSNSSCALRLFTTKCLQEVARLGKAGTADSPSQRLHLSLLWTDCSRISIVPLGVVPPWNGSALLSSTLLSSTALLFFVARGGLAFIALLLFTSLKPCWAMSLRGKLDSIQPLPAILEQCQCDARMRKL